MELFSADIIPVTEQVNESRHEEHMQQNISTLQEDRGLRSPDMGRRTDTRVTIARGDGIGPEIMDAVLRILAAAEVPLTYDEIELGEKVFEEGHSAGIAPGTWSTIRRNGILLKAPITTPQGGGVKSLNVTIRKTLNLFANVRPSKSFHPYVDSAHPDMNLVIVRENEEDLYAGIEHRQTREVTQVLKLITRPGSERIVRYAFEYARAHGRSRVTCMTKDNIMKITDGLFHSVFREVAAEYPDIESDHQIIDIGAARLAAEPESFDVIVTPNLYGDILSDIASRVSGSIGLAGSANIGSELAMFEAVHGSAPDIAGKDVANPSGLLSAAIQMLVHIGESEAAERINNAWLVTLESGIHTPDMFRRGRSKKCVGTIEFANEIIRNLGRKPRELEPVSYRAGGIEIPAPQPRLEKKTLRGVDVFLDWDEADRDANLLGARLERIAGDGWRLKMITNRGVKVYPDGLPETFCTDHWRCRFIPDGRTEIAFRDVVTLLESLDLREAEVIKTEHLYDFDDERGYSFGQGE